MRSVNVFHMLLIGLCFSGQLFSNPGPDSSIDRRALVKRHVPVLTQADSLCPFSVGNGEFAFTVDFTGLQTFPRFYENGIPLGTLAQWGWHTVPNPKGYTLADATEMVDTYGRPVPYASKQHTEAGQWLRANPHRLHLGQIGFHILCSDSTELEISDCENVFQKADIWEGVIYSAFTADGQRVNVRTACNPDRDEIAATISSGLLETGRVGIGFDFPYGSTEWGKTACDWKNQDRHHSEIIKKTADSVHILRVLDADTYFVAIQWDGTAEFRRSGKNAFSLNILKGRRFGLTVSFSNNPVSASSEHAAEVIGTSRTHWKQFWKTGGALDLSGSTDPGARELERRVVLSRYLTAIQCAGSMPPQETGLTCNSWYGKFHLEMHWWHAVHFALWDRPDLLEKSMGWYLSKIPNAEKNARNQGYEGARWPKMVAFDARESPSGVGVFLVWQQPHPIYYAELLYRTSSDNSILHKYRDMVFATADFLASYAHWDSLSDRYVLGPPLIPAQEIYKPKKTVNPGFELAYWKFGLKTAQLWRERLGLTRIEKWDRIIKQLSPLPVTGGLYKNMEKAPDTFNNVNEMRDHPTLLGPYGMLSDNSVNVEIMRKTLEQVLKSWNWESTWGWDFPLIAMTAARVGRPDLAVEALLMDVPKNTCLKNGHNYQTARLPVYLPGNGGLLTAVAMMAAGWDGAPDCEAPGFPKDGTWQVRWENLHRLP